MQGCVNLKLSLSFSCLRELLDYSLYVRIGDSHTLLFEMASESYDNLSTTATSEGISPGFIVWTCFLIVFYAFSMAFNFWMFQYIGKYFTPSAIYQTQRIDCLITSLSHIGCLMLLVSSICETPNEHACTFANAIGMIELVQPISTCLLLAILR